MTMHLFGGLALSAIFVAGCGNGDNGGTTACTNVSGADQICFESYASNATPAALASSKADCMNGGGVASDTCPPAGADGACKTDVSQGGVTASVTTWYYAGDTASEMQACTDGGDTWIAP